MVYLAKLYAETDGKIYYTRGYRTVTTLTGTRPAYSIGDKIGAVTAAEGAYPEADQGYIYVTTSNGYTIMKNGNTYYAYLNAGAVPGYIYIGIEKEFPVYEKNFNVNIDNITECFTVENGETYYFAGLGNVFTSNNSGQANSRASTTLTALFDMNISFNYSYSSEPTYDKFTLTVGNTTIENAVSGATTIKTYSGSITAGESITFTYSKDGSRDSNNDKCTFYDMTVTSPEQIGTEIKSLARKIKSCYIGGSNGIAKRITRGYIGVNGIAKLFYTAHTHVYIDSSEYLFDDDVNEDQHYYTKTCSCGDTITVWEDHGYEEREEEATCTSDGFYTEFCPDCMKPFYYRAIDATGHDYFLDGGVDARCETDGEETYICVKCGDKDVKTIPATGHTWADATCTEPKTCTVCGATEGEALGHSYKVSKKPPTCTVDGSNTYTCLRCRYSYTETVPAPGHVADTVSGKCIVCGKDVPTHIESV